MSNFFIQLYLLLSSFCSNTEYLRIIEIINITPYVVMIYNISGFIDRIRCIYDFLELYGLVMQGFTFIVGFLTIIRDYSLY